MLASVVVGGSIGFVGAHSYPLGSAGTADPTRRGATLAVHSTLGYAGGFVGPLMVGVILDLAGGMSRAAWGSAFLAVAILMLLALVVFWLIRPRELAGDRGM